MRVRVLRPAVAAMLASLLSSAVTANEYRPEDIDEAHHEGIVYQLFLVSAESTGLAAARRRDLDYAEKMTAHHRGAVRMSEAYLDDEAGINPVLRHMADSIIRNQKFEIGWLQDLRRRVAAGPTTILEIGGLRLVGVQAGVSGMEHRREFLKSPGPSSLDIAMLEREQVSEYDVMFAKAMIMHHQMALEMAREYNTDPNGRNLVIKELNFDILRDQAIEIGLLEALIAKFPGDPDSVPIDPEMHEMMGM